MDWNRPRVNVSNEEIMLKQVKHRYRKRKNQCEEKFDPLSLVAHS